MAADSREQETVEAVKALRDQIFAEAHMQVVAEHDLNSAEVLAKEQQLPDDGDYYPRPRDDESVSLFMRDDESIVSQEQTQGRSLSKSKNRIRAWLSANNRYVCHVSKLPFDEDVPVMIQLAYVLLPRHARKQRGKTELFERYAYVLGIQKEYFGIYNRLFIMPLCIDIRMKLEYRNLFFLPHEAYLELSRLYLVKVIEHRKADPQTECTLWREMKDGKLFNGLFKGGNYYPYILLSSPFANSRNLPISQRLDLAEGETVRQYRYFPPPYHSFPPVFSHVHPLAITINAKQALEYGAEKLRQPDINSAERNDLVMKPLGPLSSDACEVLETALSQYGMGADEATAYAMKFRELISKIAELEGMWNQSRKEKEHEMDKRAKYSPVSRIIPNIFKRILSS